jgi:hypothetical protein
LEEWKEQWRAIKEGKDYSGTLEIWTLLSYRYKI